MSEFLKSYKEIESVLKNCGAEKPMLVCGKSFQKTDVFEYLKQFDIVIYDNIRPNPRFDDMLPAAELFRSEGCDFMIAAGGGSPMDTAKMIRLMATNTAVDALQTPLEDNEYPALFIPTTAGSGSEATKISVFYLHETDKFSVHNDAFIPPYVLFDARLLETLPIYQKKSTALDTLCHAIESFISTKATAESQAFSRKAIQLFWQHKDGYLGNIPQGNAGMLEASYYAGKAINLAGTVAAHALYYLITMHCGTAHGHSVALCLSKIWEYMIENNTCVNDKRGRAYVLETFEELGRLMGGKTAAEGCRVFCSLLAEWLPEPLTVSEACIAAFAAKVQIPKLVAHPTVLEASDIKALYKRIVS